MNLQIKYVQCKHTKKVNKRAELQKLQIEQTQIMAKQIQEKCTTSTNRQFQQKSQFIRNKSIEELIKIEDQAMASNTNNTGTLNILNKNHNANQKTSMNNPNRNKSAINTSKTINHDSKFRKSFPNFHLLSPEQLLYRSTNKLKFEQKYGNTAFRSIASQSEYNGKQYQFRKRNKKLELGTKKNISTLPVRTIKDKINPPKNYNLHKSIFQPQTPNFINRKNSSLYDQDDLFLRANSTSESKEEINTRELTTSTPSHKTYYRQLMSIQSSIHGHAKKSLNNILVKCGVLLPIRSSMTITENDIFIN